MAQTSVSDQPFNIMVVGQSGRLEYEALLFVASLRALTPNFAGKIVVVEPQPNDKWDHDPRMSDGVRTMLAIQCNRLTQ